MKPYLFSPALPAVAILYGLVFIFAFTHFAGLRWHLSITLAFYSGLFAWVVLLAWRQRALWATFGVIDALFCVFILWVLTSLLIQGDPGYVAFKYGRYLPFLVILPYVCGRLMRVIDLSLFYKIIAWASIVLLMLLVIDYWQYLSKLVIYSRWPFFGHDYALLLVAMLLAASLVILSFFFFTGPGKSYRQLSSRQLLQLGILGLIAAAMVAVASRGALLVGVSGTLWAVLIVKHWSFSKKFQFLLYLAVIMSSAYLVLPKPQAQIYAKSVAIPDMVLVSADTYQFTREWRSVTRPKILEAPGTPEGGEGDLIARAWGQVTWAWDNVTWAFTWAWDNLTWALTWAWENVKWAWHRATLAGEQASRKSVPIFGPASCLPIEKGIDSVAIRYLLYHEAKAVFINSPLWGVGAASFGRYSCAGETGYPHNTVLQSFAELGIVGGLLYCGLLVIALFGFFRRAFNGTVKKTSAVAQLSLSLYVMYLLTDQLYGNYFMAAGSYFMIGVAASMRSNPAWGDSPDGRDG